MLNPDEPILTGRQQLIYASLTTKVSQAMADLYEVAMRTYRREGDPIRLCLAGHLIREMMGDLPKSLELPVLAKQGRLHDHVAALESSWSSAGESRCNQDGHWKGEIDKPLRKFLQEIPSIFRAINDIRPKRRVATAELFRGLDPTGLALPDALEKERVTAWLDVFGYFNGVAHRGSTTPEEFAAQLDSLEQMLLDALYPRPSEDLTEIDRILSEGERDA